VDLIRTQMAGVVSVMGHTSLRWSKSSSNMGVRGVRGKYGCALTVVVDDGAVVVEPMPVSTAQINDYAGRVGSEFEVYDHNGRADLDLLLSRLGGEVEVRDGIESLAIHDDGTFTVYVPSRTSPRRDRFTIAHEIGHFLLHYLNGDKSVRRFTRAGSNGAETQANYFAQR